MHERAGDDEHRERRGHRQIAPVPADYDFTGGDGKQRCREGKIDHHGEP